jgi:hypothetical protein
MIAYQLYYVLVTLCILHVVGMKAGQGWFPEPEGSLYKDLTISGERGERILPINIYFTS